MKKGKIFEERGSMAVYVTVVLMSFLIVLTMIYSSSLSARKNQLKSVLIIKQSYEKDNANIEEIYEKLEEKINQ